MNQLNSVSNLHVEHNGSFIKTINPTQEPNTLIRSVALLHLHHLSNLDEAVCQIRDLATGAIRQTLASKLFPISYGKDAYLLELTSAMEGDNNV